jgi:hypothetical protein
MSRFCGCLWLLGVFMLAERRMGELMEYQWQKIGLNNGAATPTRVDEKPTLTEAGIDKYLADVARKIEGSRA